MVVVGAEGVTDRAPEREVSTAVHPVWGLVCIPCLKSPFAIRKHRLNLVNWSRGLGEVMGIESLAWESKGTPDPTRHCNSMPVRTLRGGGRYSRPCSMRRRLMRRRLKRRRLERRRLMRRRLKSRRLERRRLMKRRLMSRARAVRPGESIRGIPWEIPEGPSSRISENVQLGM